LIPAVEPRPVGRIVSPARARFLNILCVLCCALSCAAAPPLEPAAANGIHYPRRAPGCDLAVYHTPVPGVAAWDDLGLAEATCNINDSPGECLRLLKAEACRMGGDIIYNLPRKPYRPRDQVLQYRAQVAHTQASTTKSEDPDLPAPASPQESALPVVPLPSGEK
jgi:hypothetical protein